MSWLTSALRHRCDGPGHPPGQPLPRNELVCEAGTRFSHNPATLLILSAPCFLSQVNLFELTQIYLFTLT